MTVRELKEMIKNWPETNNFGESCDEGMSMNMVSFCNNGRIDPCMWSTFGVSVKDSSSPIGQFGTGLKYAIAVLMRAGRNLKITSCGDEYIFGVEMTMFRDKEFQCVTCNGEKLPFTTSLGSHWELWQAYRELYSNCLDEGGKFGDDLDTVIYAEIGDIRHHDVFLGKKNPIIATPFIEVYEGGSRFIYVKGVRAKELSCPSMYTYNLFRADLTEDRTIAYSYQIDEAISNAVTENSDSDFAHNFLINSKGFFEEDVSFMHCTTMPSGKIIDLVGKYRRDDIYMQPKLFALTKNVLGELPPTEIMADDRQLAIINKAIVFCDNIGFPIKFNIKVSDFLGRQVLGMADMRSDTIYLSERVLSMGTKQVVSTLIEENIHLSKKYSDLSYEMQNYLFDLIVTMGERLAGEIL